MATVNVTDETFEDLVVNSEIPVVIDFWAEWCGPCKQIGPALEELSTEYGERIKIAKINVDENPNSPSKWAYGGYQHYLSLRMEKWFPLKLERHLKRL